MNPRLQPFKNRVLASLPKAVARLEPHLSLVSLAQETTLFDGVANHGYFLEEGMASVVVILEDGATLEVGVIGFEGVVGIPILLGTNGAPGRTFMQISGSGYRMKAQELREEFERPGGLRKHPAEIHACLPGTNRANRGLQPPAQH